MVRFLRQPTRIAAAIGTPLLVWALMGSGFARSFQPPQRVDVGMNAGGEGALPYALYLLPGMMTMVALFTAIFSSISIIDDRNEGWLQSVLVSPAPRWSIALGKVLGGATLAFAQAAVLLLALPLWHAWPGAARLGLALYALAITVLMMTGVGVAFAWKSESTQGFHAVMNLVLMPMWLLSGAFFPIEGAARWLATLMRFNPLTWCHQALAAPLTGRGTIDVAPYVVATLGATAAFATATALIARPQRGGGRLMIGRVLLPGRSAPQRRGLAAHDGLVWIALVTVCGGVIVWSWWSRRDDASAAGPPIRIQLIDHEGRPFDSASLEGHLWLVDFIFTNCAGPCPVMTAKMKRLQDELADVENLHFVSVTCDPRRDTPGVLKAYAQERGADLSRWTFLTGDYAAIQRYATDLLLALDNPHQRAEDQAAPAGEVDRVAEIVHSTRIVLVDEKGRVVDWFSGTDEEGLKALKIRVREMAD